ncbi:REF/SRPP-like protein At3g05500 [Nicotiana tabacum]|uniref:REF/SRPP-like protein At3g05500 n=2 Tax=Nicotiana TaxID=4085 RepID=A0A1S4DA13_TOBAC|nr:PREDICTED: REF/SRPP-like protein At3g05500 [Nicotiana sylvestris]XP_016510231.1 PREDICTED: REF/SRPP-like protein At3g05500 [Nicotiana tabacum]
MAESNPKPQLPEMAQTEEEKLKYLEFLQVAMIHAALYVAKVYGYAKENSGPLKPGVQTVEGTVKTVVGPVYDKFHDVPVEVLKFVDRKVDESVRKIETRVPPMVKQAPAAARSVAADVKSAGVIGAASGLAKTVYAKYEPAAKGLYTKYEPMAEQYAASAWLSLNRLPVVPKVTQAVAPTAAYYSGKYNEIVQQSAEKGYKVASYLPLVPTEKISKVFSTQPMASN